MGRRTWTVAVLLVGALYLTGCGKEPEPPQPEWTLVQETAAVLPDGARVDLWHTDANSYNIYKLSDGTALLAVQGPNALGSVTTEGVDGFDALSADAKRAVQLYFDEQGTLYDVQKELEAAYAAYGTDWEDWTERVVVQEIRPVASSSRMMSFYTSLSVNGSPLPDYRLGAVFDRETGKKIELWELFTVSQETAMERLLEGGEIRDPALYAELAAALQPDRVVLFEDCVGVYFPKSLLTTMDSYEFTVSYDALTDVLQPWAIPSDGQSAPR